MNGPEARHLLEDFWAAYTDAVDTRDFAALEQLIGAGAVEVGGGRTEGGAAVTELYGRVLPARPHGHHLVTNAHVTVVGDLLVGECRYQFVGGPDLRVQVLGRYRTELVAEGSGARLRSHTIRREFESAPDSTFTASAAG